MFRLVSLPIVAVLLSSLLSCGGDSRKEDASTLPDAGRQMTQRAEAKRAFDALEMELVENAGLVFEDFRVDPDSIRVTISLSDDAIAVWRETEKALGRPPSLAWATVSARFYRGGELSATHSLRFAQVRKLGPAQRLITVSLAQNPMRASRQTPQIPVHEGEVQCTVLGVRVE
ncbi:hypothetical protein JXA88_13530 [Candidatus Fermentibacteria bacterium]|nr:hypothetical protein [Candidatus Fermentibacteria bacterium]